MIKKRLSLVWILTLATAALFAQQYERHKSLKDTTLFSKHLGFEKKISILVPREWQKDIKNDFPLIIVFDRQNQRSNQYILNTIDYLVSNEQMPSCIVISVASEQRYRYRETQYPISDSNGRAGENEKFIFEELIPLAEKEYKASAFRLFIGHSRYGYFTTSLLHSRTNELNGIISMSPFYGQKHVDLTDSVMQLNNRSFHSKKYYRFGIGNDYPDDFAKMNAVISKRVANPFLDMKGYHFKQADHNATPGLLISTALYEIFEAWSGIQSRYISNEQKEVGVKTLLDKAIVANYGVTLRFSLGILNGKGWYFYNEKQYAKAIQAWKTLIDAYPNFSEGYLYIIDAQIQLQQSYNETVEAFKSSLASSQFYTDQEKKALETELKEMIK